MTQRTWASQSCFKSRNAISKSKATCTNVRDTSMAVNGDVPGVVSNNECKVAAERG